MRIHWLLVVILILAVGFSLSANPRPVRAATITTVDSAVRALQRRLGVRLG